MIPARRAAAPAALLASVALATPAAAQLSVDLQIEKTQFVAYEPVKATVTVHNRAGQDVVLGGPGGSGWLSFDVRSGTTIVSPRAGRGFGAEPFLLSAGQKITKTVNVGSLYPLGEFGDYSFNAQVYFPPLGQFFNSQRKRISISNPRPFWSESIGVPQGPGRLASFREYSLLIHRGASTAHLYMRLKEARGPRVYATYSLGRYVDIGKPQAIADSEARLHVLHMVSPRVYQHAIVRPDGSFEGATIYQDMPSSRPKLMIDGAGVVQVRGGQRYDPEAAAAVAELEAGVRSASDRPGGLPE